ncbi:NADP(H)-dependent aldo-keto reductase [Urechidicola croceus]|uniref:Aldo/keto reductase n=1 Tax=Urechidicola croceus TaxID=1850246 RepID=A0A1D8P971_9FLAO|nr:NADP(H)-dependent aldo-keto reductase [Urechidicola croceus]AOW21125.1 aldo/keto reductase [Urechidicola croceus]
MRYTKLPNTNYEVSKICLGTMTWGEQNSEKEAHEQLDFAVENGINFIDTAELYAVPTSPETQGLTEKYIGTWLAKGNRDKIIIASKVAGPNTVNRHNIRDDGFTREVINQAVDNSLKRMKTDHIELYQLHWPERKTNCFGKRNFIYDPSDEWQDNFHDILETLDELIKAGKIGHVGLSNETPWGLMRYLEEHKYKGLPKMISVQNPYNLLNRTYEIGLSEMSIRENVACLPYSPLAWGYLSGKYIGGKTPKGRITDYPRMKRFTNPQTIIATEKYAEVAKKHGLSLTQMSLAFVNDQPFVTSNIIGATSIPQLKENIESINVRLTDECYSDIELVNTQHPNPAP